VLDGTGQEQCSKLMAHSITLELGGGLAGVPIILGKLTKVDINGLGQEWT
jgi:hypothetical protein